MQTFSLLSSSSNALYHIEVKTPKKVLYLQTPTSLIKMLLKTAFQSANF